MRLYAQRYKILAALTLNLVLLLSLCLLYARMYPLPRGTSNSFWIGATRVDLSRANDSVIMTARIIGDSAYYLPASMDAVWVYQLPADEAMHDFPEVLKQLQTAAADTNNKNDNAIAYRHWSSLDPSSQNGINGLILALQQATAQRISKDPSYSPGTASLFLKENHELSTQISRANRYPLNFIFEFLFLSALLWFLFWPFLQQSSLRRKLLHLALAPFLFLTPAWMGYCAICANGVGPAGGIVYPYLLWLAHAASFQQNASWEITFLDTIPQLLQPLNQTSWDLVDVLQQSSLFAGLYISGPIHAALASLILCTALLLIYYRSQAISSLRAFRALRD